MTTDPYARTLDVSLDDFIADPRRYLALAASKKETLYIMDGRRLAFAVDEGSVHMAWASRYFSASLKAGTIDPKLAESVAQLDALKFPVGNS